MTSALSSTRALPLPALSLDTTAQLLMRYLRLHTTLCRVQLSRHLGVSSRDLEALELIQAYGSLSIGQLTQLSGLSTGGTTATVDRLSAAGLIERIVTEGDRRSTSLRIASADIAVALDDAACAATAAALADLPVDLHLRWAQRLHQRLQRTCEQTRPGIKPLAPTMARTAPRPMRALSRARSEPVQPWLSVPG